MKLITVMLLFSLFATSSAFACKKKPKDSGGGGAQASSAGNGGAGAPQASGPPPCPSDAPSSEQGRCVRRPDLPPGAWDNPDPMSGGNQLAM